MMNPYIAPAFGFGGLALAAAGLWVARVAVRAHRHTTAGLVRLPSGRHVTIRTGPPLYDQDSARDWPTS